MLLKFCKKKKGVEAITAIISEREIDIDTHILEEIALKDFIYIIYAFEFLNQNSDMEEGEWGEEKLECAHIYNICKKTYTYIHFQLQYKREKSEVTRNI